MSVIPSCSSMTGLDQARGGDAFFARDVVQRAALVILAPASPVADAFEQFCDLSGRVWGCHRAAPPCQGLPYLLSTFRPRTQRQGPGCRSSIVAARVVRYLALICADSSRAREKARSTSGLPRLVATASAPPRGAVHADRRALRTALDADHQQSGLLRMGADLQGADGDRGCHRSPGPSRSDSGVQGAELSHTQAPADQRKRNCRKRRYDTGLKGAPVMVGAPGARRTIRVAQRHARRGYQVARDVVAAIGTVALSAQAALFVEHDKHFKEWPSAAGVPAGAVLKGLLICTYH
jgi:hypothetical protein